MRISENTAAKFGFVVALLILVAIAAYSYQSTRVLINTARQVADTHEIVGKLDDLLAQVVEVESAARGFVVTGETYYLDPLDSAIPKAFQNGKELEKLLKGNPRIRNLNALVLKKIERDRLLVEQRKSGGFKSAQAFLFSGKGHALMDAIRGEISAIIGEKKKLGNQQESTARKKAERSLAVLILGSFLSIGLLSLTFHNLTRQMSRRREAEDKMRLQADIVAQIHESVVSTDLNGYVTTWNKGAVRLTGYPAEEAIGRHISFLYPKEEHGFLQSGVIDPLITKGNHEAEVRMRRKSGKEVYAHIYLSLLHDGEGKISGMIGYSMDVTDRKKAAEALRESEERLRQMAENIEEMFWITNADLSKILYVSPVYEKISGRSCRELYENPKSFLDAVYPEDYGRVFQSVENALKGAPYSEEFRIIRPDGTVRWVWDRSFQIRDQSGRLHRFVGITQDITDRKRREEEIRTLNQDLERRVMERTSELAQANDALKARNREVQESEQSAMARADELAAFMDAMPAITFIAHDPQCRHMTSSRAGCEILGVVEGSNTSLSADEGERPTTFRALMNGRELTADELPLQVAAATGKAVRNCELTLAVADGTNREIAGNAVPLFGQDGMVRGAVGVFLEITDRKRIEEALRKLNSRLEQTVQERTAELADRAVQLRALSGELALSEQRERQRLSQVLHDGLQQILVGAKYQVAFASRSENVALELEQVSDLIDDAIRTSRSLTAELSPPVLLKGDLFLALEWLARWVHDQYELKVDLVARKKVAPLTEDVTLVLFQSARELLFNIVKHAGVKTARMQIDKLDGEIVVTIEDEGIGFDPNRLRAEGGQAGGFGLFSVSERLSYMGGRMQIKSSPGLGSQFTLAIPIFIATAAVDRTPAKRRAQAHDAVSSRSRIVSSDSKKVRLVLVDDHLVMRQGLAGLLRLEPDFEIVGEASSGEAAVDLIQQIRPDVVLMDVGMHEMDGIEATRIIHKELPDVRIIGLSMFHENHQAAAMREAGAVNYLTKSGASEAVIAAIRECIPHSNRMQRPKSRSGRAHSNRSG